ncbi:QWRF motif-containing protein 3 [Mercurialis annua]|uniref:QWRF motif-containing protein 3 n=1 Tax=Mercurialis annua TaxID=3986 RepID=UPI002161002C|nr:QWRF motif-containing protein 3 [Mercurialis annua]
MKTDTEASLSNQYLKLKKLKSRGVSSRYLSPVSTSQDHRLSTPSPTSSQASSLVRHKSTDDKKHRSVDDSGFTRGLWPSSSASSSPSHYSSLNNKNNLGTLADHLGNERLRDLLDKKKDEKPSKNSSSVFSITRQRSCSEFSRFENQNQNEKEKEITKENHRQLGGSLRYTKKLFLPGRASSSSSSSSSANNLFDSSNFASGRLSVDENALFRNSKTTAASRRKSDSVSVSVSDNLDSESECTDCNSPAMGRTSRKSGIEVSSKYLQDVSTKLRRGSSDSNIKPPLSLDGSPKMRKFNIKNAIKRANSLTGYGSATSQWALSPGRSGSPPMSVESKERLMSFSSMKPPSSPSRSSTKGMEKLLNLGLDLFKSKKVAWPSSSDLGSGNSESIHQLRMLHNGQMQWRYANDRVNAVNGNIAKQVENDLFCACESLENLRKSVMLKKLQLQKEKCDMKLDLILHSQIKQLEAWGDMERQHMSAVSKTKECLHSVVCKVPLIEGAKVDPQSTFIALRHASDLTTSVKSVLTTFLPLTEKNAELLSELAQVVSQEKLLLEECVELLQSVSTLEIQERSLKCYMIQLSQWQQQIIV